MVSNIDVLIANITSASKIQVFNVYSCYAPNFEEVEEAYWFGFAHLSVCPSVRLSVTLAPGQEPLERGS